MGTGQVSGEASGQSVQDELKVFISYSRRDAEFVDRLQDALAARGITAHVDRQDIEKGEEWWARIQDLISGADTIVFVMSPDAVNSPVCRQEVAYASEMNKRFVPIVVRDVDGLDVPDELARLNYIFFIANSSVGASGEFDEAVDQLVHALETDIQWIREHTRLGMLAARWAAHSHPGDLLLRGVDLTRAEDWLASRPRKAPDPTNLHVTYITESRRAATKRQRFVIGLSTAAVVVALVLAALAYWQRGIALENEAVAKTERDRALVGQSLFLTKTGDEHLSAGDPQSAILLNLEALPDEASGVARPLVAEAEAGLYLALSRSGTSQALAVTHSKSEIVFSPDGRYIGVTPAGFTDYGDVAARVYDLKTAAHVFTIPGRVVAVEFSADQSAIIALVDGQTIEGPVHIEVYSWPERKLRLRFEVGLRSPDSLAVSRDGKLVAAAGYAGAIGLWNLHDGSKLAEATAHDGETIPDLEFSPDGKRLASAGFNSSAMLWAVPTLEPIAKLICNKEHVQQVHFNEDGRRLTTRCLGMAALWHGETGGKITDLGDERTKDSIRKVWFEQAGEVEVVVTASGNGTLTWDPQTGAMRSKIASHGVMTSFRNGAYYTRSAVMDIGGDGTVKRSLLDIGCCADVEDLHLTPDHKRLIVDTGQNRLMVHKLELPETSSFETSSQYLGGARRSHFSADGQAIVTHVEPQGKASLWRADALEPVRAFDEAVKQAVFSPAGDRLAFIREQGEVLLIDVQSGQGLWETESSLNAWRLAFRGDGRGITAVRIDGSFTVLDAETGRALKGNTQFGAKGLDLSHPRVVAIAQSSRGDLAVARPSGETFIWREKENKAVATIGGHNPWQGFGENRSGIEHLSYAPDGGLLVTAGEDYLARVWDGQSYELVYTLSGHEQPIEYVAFSPDGTMILTVSLDRSARVWSAKSGELMARVQGLDCKVKHAIFAPDSKRIATLCETVNTAMLWDARNGKPWGRMKVRETFPNALVFHPKGTHIIVSGTAREVLPYFSSVDGLVAKAKQAATRCLTPEERQKYGLAREPRRWCITCAGLENEKDPTGWRALWPYQGAAWRNWLVALDQGKHVAAPADQKQLSGK